MLVILLLAMALALIGAPGASACPDGHRFETFTLAAPALEREKRILIYLPPGYDCTHARYPVLYANDGHDLFAWNPFAAELEPAVAEEIAARAGWYGSWRLAEQLDRAIVTGDLPAMMVVGIASDDGQRSRDLAPVPWDGSADARGVAYGAFVAGTLVDVIDRTYRTVTDRRCRGIGGASLGAISALQIGLAHDSTFAITLGLSPILRDPAIAAFVAARWQAEDHGTTRFLIDFDDNPIGRADLVWFQSMDGATRHPRRATLAQTPGGQHNIASWAERVLPALERLFDRRCLD